MTSFDGRYVIAYNGEVYNFRELKALLPVDIVWRGDSDTEVVVNSIAVWGMAAFERFEGMFAIALYDRKKQALTLARDSFGIKPLYYHQDVRRLVFSSEIKPLLLDPSTPRRPNLTALRQTVVLGYALDPYTAFEEVLRVMPGSFITFHEDGRQVAKTYWTVDRLLEPTDESLLDVIDESVDAHLIADAPTGIFLSGGMDSSLLLSRAARFAPPHNFVAYNVGVDTAGTRATPLEIERFGAERAAAYYRVPLARIDANDATIPSFASLVASVEEPIANPANSLIDRVAAAARERGTKVLLAGHGGDETFAGYRRHIVARYLATLRLSPVAAALRAVAAAVHQPLLARVSAASNGGSPAGMISLVAPGWGLVQREVASQDWLGVREQREALAPLEDMLRAWRDLSPLKQMMLLDLRTYLAAQNLINMDKVSMRHSVEVRVPFLYRPLARIGISTPDGLLVRGRRGKLPLRNAAREVLPSVLQSFPKMGFGPELGRILRTPEMKDVLLGSEIAKRGMFNRRSVETLWREATSLDGATPPGIELYSIAVVEQWFREFMSGATHVGQRSH
jgi:asparagine synthase (glutamine-hydrolysing)